MMSQTEKNVRSEIQRLKLELLKDYPEQIKSEIRLEIERLRRTLPEIHTNTPK